MYTIMLHSCVPSPKLAASTKFSVAQEGLKCEKVTGGLQLAAHGTAYLVN